MMGLFKRAFVVKRIEDNTFIGKKHETEELTIEVDPINAEHFEYYDEAITFIDLEFVSATPLQIIEIFWK